jgi:hypothetical protein
MIDTIRSSFLSEPEKVALNQELKGPAGHGSSMSSVTFSRVWRSRRGFSEVLLVGGVKQSV